MSHHSVILATGSFVPDQIITNDNLGKFPPSLVPLIEQKTGVKARRFAEADQCTSDLAILAGQRCLAKAGFAPEKLDAIILATSSPDRLQPPTATRVQHGLGATRAFAFDLNAVCSGGVFALTVADAYLKAGFCKNILVIAAEIYSRFLDPADFSTYPYFGDGAGAVLLTAKDKTDRGIMHSILRTDGSKADIIQVPAGGTMRPYGLMKNPRDAYFKMVGREVYEFAVTKGTEVVEEIIREAKVDREDISFIIPHQANLNIIKELSSRLHLGMDKFIVNLDKYGNTAAASVLIALDELWDSEIAKDGDLILLVAFGGGLSWGANLIKF